MDKRAVVSFFVCMLLSVGLILRVAVINNGFSSDAAATGSGRRITVASSRGMIYDRNMLPLVNRQEKTVIAVNPDEEAIDYLKNCLTQQEYSVVCQKAVYQKPFLLECEKYDGDCDSVISVTVCDRYSSSDTAVHTIGYTDSQGKGVYGLEKAFDDILTQYSGNLSVRYTADAQGRMLKGEAFETVSENYACAGGIVLTIDSMIQRVCEEAAERNNMQAGGIVVLDAETSGIVALVSLPGFDRDDLVSATENDDSPFLNRILNAYPVGSVFKPVVVAAALECGIDENTVFECKGYVMINGQRVNCHKKDGHGMIDMARATAVSCNAYFIQLGQITGRENILNTASLLGLGKEIELDESIVSSAGILPEAVSVDSSAALANLSFGQGDLLATPLQIAAVYCAFANGGYYRQPYLIENTVNEDGEVIQTHEAEKGSKVLTDSICRKIGEMLELTVADGSGKLAAPMWCDAAGKTATAETGRMKNGEKIYHTWFAGFYPYESPEYVIVVFNEYGNSSATDCAPVFRDIADSITSSFQE